MNNIKAIVTDIEGTTSSLSFVKDVLFPYARKHIGEFVRENSENEKIKSLLNDVQTEAGKTLDIVETAVLLEQWIDNDKKITPLKSLQGLLWEKGYQQGDFRGHIYPDAYEQLKSWQQQGIKLFVYSSGSVYAQKLLFGHTEYGDLNHLFSGYFDTHVGAKVDADSYCKIAEQAGYNVKEMLFLSDIEAELDAAVTAGMKVTWLMRDAKTSVDAKYLQVNSFSDIELCY